jgi:PAS domain S-box-containing protein
MSSQTFEPNHRILLIDDIEEIHEDLRKILTPERNIAELQADEALLFGTAPTAMVRFEVDSAYQGQEGLEKVRQALLEGRPYAMIFVDIRMPPGWDGVETIARIWQVDPHVQAVVCTAYSDYSWHDIHKRLGPSDSLLILKKPFDSIEVVQLAHALTGKWEATRQAAIRMADLDRMVAQRTEALQESEATLRGLCDSAFDAIAMVDGEGRLTLWNPAAERMFGYRASEILGRPIDGLVAPARGRAQFQADFPIFRKTAAGPLSGKVAEAVGLRKDGTEFPMELSLAAIQEGKQWQAVAIVRDVTARYEAGKRIQEANYRYNLIAQQSRTIVWEVDAEGLYTYVSPASEVVWGYLPEELAGTRHFYDIHPEEGREAFRAAALETFARQGEFRNLENQVQTRDGRTVWVSTSGIPILDDEGKLLGYRGCDIDITERMQAEARLMQAQKMESVGRLAGGVAHDFNNLLTVINGYSQLLLERLSEGDPMRDNVSEIHKAGKRAAGLTQQLLAFSRKQVLQPRLLDLNRVVAEMRPMLARLVGEDVELSVELHPEATMVCADPHQLEQALMNLLVNSRDAMPQGGKLSIETSVVAPGASHVQSVPGPDAGCYVMLAVSDTGVGMNEETRQHIFEPFFTTKEVGKGTGLGLSMIQGIVAQSGGYIEVDSAPGCGTTFKIYLPKVTEVPGGTEEPAAVPAIGGKETVLVVEDQPDVRKYAAVALGAYGYRVIQAGNAGEALAYCERGFERIDLVLTDMVMPHLSGRELADLLAKRWPGIKVLFMSGYTGDAIMRQGVLEAGAEFIQKPFTPEQLATKVRGVLAASSNPARILVADDEAGVRRFLRTVLENGGYSVIEAENGKQALEEVRAGEVDLVITDLVMPEQEGIETIPILRREFPAMGIIAVSGAFGGQFLKPARMLGADAVLSKPVGAGLLLTTVQEVLQARR